MENVRVNIAGRLGTVVGPATVNGKLSKTIAKIRWDKGSENDIGIILVSGIPESIITPRDSFNYKPGDRK